MPKELKVWGVGRDWRRDCPRAANGTQQTREVVAARSMAEAARLLKVSPSRLKNFGSPTGNPEEIRIAMSKPGTVFWIPSMERIGRGELPWREGAPT